MSINLFLESLWSFVPGQVLKSGCPILSIMEDLLLILHLIPWTLCAFFFFHQMKIIGLPSVEVCIASNALYSTSTLIIKSYFVCKESLKQRKKLKVCYWVMSVRWQNRKLWILHLPNILIQSGHEDKNPFVRYPETGSKLCVTLCVCVHSVAHVTLASRKLGKLKSEGNLRHPLCIISTPSIALYDQKEIPKISAFFRERSGVNLTPYDPASLGASQKPGFCIACLRVLMEPGILWWFSC